MSVASIIERFGGVRPLARLLGRSPSAVQHWKNVDHIPAHRQQAVLECGQQLDPPLQPHDFFRRAEER